MTTTTTSPESLRQGPQRARDLERAGWARPAAIAGFTFVVFDVICAFLPGTPAASDASAAKIATYFHNHSGALKGQLLLGGLGIAALLWWFGALWRMLSRAEDEKPRLAIVAAVSLAIGLTLALVSGGINSAAAFRSDSVATTHLFYSFSLVVTAAAGFGVGMFLIAACTVTYRSRITPRWVSYVGWTAGICFLAGTAATMTDSNPVNLLGLFSFLLWCVWILAISTLMWRRTAY